MYSAAGDIGCIFEKEKFAASESSPWYSNIENRNIFDKHFGRKSKQPLLKIKF